MTWPCSRTVDIRSEKNGFDPVEGGMDSPPVKSIRWFISVSHLYLVYISECGCHYKPSWWYKAWLYYRELLNSLRFGTNNCSVITDISGLKYAFVKSYLYINASVQLIKLYPKNVDECFCLHQGLWDWFVIGKATEWYDPNENLLSIYETDSQKIRVQSLMKICHYTQFFNLIIPRKFILVPKLRFSNVQ